MTRLTRKFAIYAAAIALCFAFAVVAEACPTCKNSSEAGAGDLVSGYGWSIVFMMSMPFLILTSLSCYFYYEIRKARRQQLADGTAAQLVDRQMPMETA